MTNNYPIISVRDKSLKSEPNLPSYERAYQTFNLKSAASSEIKYFPGYRLNAAYNAIERQVLTARKNKVAGYFVDDHFNEQILTFAQLNDLSNQFANFLKHLGVKRGDRVFFFLPRVPELFYGFLGTLKIGAIAGTLFSAFQTQGLVDRLKDSGARVLITNAQLKPRVDAGRRSLPDLRTVVTIETLADKLANMTSHLRCAAMKPEDPAFMLYTSGTTGKPKGVIHTHNAILGEHLTAKWVLDLKEDDTYWCTADPGWVTGIAYEILGSLSNGAATVIYSGRFDPLMWYKIIEKYRVNVWYTAPTAIRMLQAAGSDIVRKHNLSSLRHIVSVGEPLNPQPLLWAQRVYGLPFHDTWWQTETGSIMIANYPSLPIKPGSMGKPVPGVTAGIVDDSGKSVPPLTEGNLAIRRGWPSMMKTIWRRPKKYASYFIGDWYISGDRAYVDRDGYFWFVGRADDVIKTSGERVGPFEVESALVAHPAVIEAGVIGKPDAIRGEIIKAFVVLEGKYHHATKSRTDANQLKEELSIYVKKHLAGHAYPREIEFIDKLPKTRSGKIMRRILKAKEMGLPIGDTSTLEEY